MMILAKKRERSSKTYHSSKGTFTNDNDKEDQEKFYNSKLNDRFKKFGIKPECDLDCLYDGGID